MFLISFIANANAQTTLVDYQKVFTSFDCFQKSPKIGSVEDAYYNIGGKGRNGKTCVSGSFCYMACLVKPDAFAKGFQVALEYRRPSTTATTVDFYFYKVGDVTNTTSLQYPSSGGTGGEITELYLAGAAGTSFSGSSYIAATLADFTTTAPKPYAGRNWNYEEVELTKDMYILIEIVVQPSGGYTDLSQVPASNRFSFFGGKVVFLEQDQTTIPATDKYYR